MYRSIGDDRDGSEGSLLWCWFSCLQITSSSPRGQSSRPLDDRSNEHIGVIRPAASLPTDSCPCQQNYGDESSSLLAEQQQRQQEHVTEGNNNIEDNSPWKLEDKWSASAAGLPHSYNKPKGPCVPLDRNGLLNTEPGCWSLTGGNTLYKPLDVIVSCTVC